MPGLCVVCLEVRPEAIKLPCNCIYCHGCIRHFLQDVLKNQLAYPWRCCMQIVEKHVVASALTESLSRDWDARHAQHEANQHLIPKCAWEECGVELEHGNITINIAFCHMCSRETCMICRRKSHEIQACPANAAEDAQLSAMVTTEKLQRCYQCRAIVQRDRGCNHITCICKAEFCYLCGNPWKNCDCSLFDMPDLPQVPQPMYVVMPGGNLALHYYMPPLLLPLPPPPPRPCHHDVQRRVQGPLYCDGCGWRGVHYLNQCMACGFLFCNRCGPPYPQPWAWRDLLPA